MASVEERTLEITRLYDRDFASGNDFDSSGLPLDYERITPAWLSPIICAGHNGCEVTAVQLDKRDDGSSNRRRIFIEYNDAGQEAKLPKSVFGKASHGLRNRINYAFSGVGHCEVAFFEKLRPYCDFETPRAFFARYNPENYNSLVLLEDIADRVEFCDHRTPISRLRAEGEMRLLAKMHASFENHDRFNAEKLDIPTWPEFFYNCAANDLEACGARGFREAEPQIPPRLFRRATEIWTATLQSVEIHKNALSTMLQGDCHVKQWYIRKDGPAEVMGLTDWQNCCFGHWGRDLAYNIATSLTVENRRNWDRELIALYIEELGQQGGTVPTFDDAWKAYRQNLFSALAWWTATLTPNHNQPDMQPEDTSREFIHRITHAIDDHDALASFGH